MAPTSLSAYIDPNKPGKEYANILHGQSVHIADKVLISVVLHVDKGNKGKLQQLTDLVQRGMSAVTSRATSRSHSRGATQDLDNFDHMQTKIAEVQSHSRQMSSKQLLQGQRLSSGPVAEGHEGGPLQRQQNSTGTYRYRYAQPASSWLQLMVHYCIQRIPILARSAGTSAADHSVNASSISLSAYLDVLAAQPSQSASSAALLYSQPHWKPGSSLSCEGPQIALQPSGLHCPESVSSRAAALLRTQGFLSSPRAVAEGTESRTATKTTQQRPAFGFMSGGPTGRSASVTGLARSASGRAAAAAAQTDPEAVRHIVEAAGHAEGQGELLDAIPQTNLSSL